VSRDTPSLCLLLAAKRKLFPPPDAVVPHSSTRLSRRASGL